MRFHRITILHKNPFLLTDELPHHRGLVYLWNAVVKRIVGGVRSRQTLACRMARVPVLSGKEMIGVAYLGNVRVYHVLRKHAVCVTWSTEQKGRFRSHFCEIIVHIDIADVVSTTKETCGEV